jgi:hypothetical protein
MKSIKSLWPSLSPAGLRGSMFTRALVVGLDCLSDDLRPTEADDPCADVEPFPLMLTNGCTGFSWPGGGPVDRIKSAKSRMESESMRGSRARGLVTTFRLDDGLWCGAVGTLPFAPCLFGNPVVPNELSLSALTRGYTVTEDALGRSGWRCCSC